MIIEERVLIENDWREKVATKHKAKKQKELCLKLFRERKEIRKNAAKANKKAKETSTITRPFEKKTNLMAPFYGWGSTASRLQPLRGGSLLFTIQKYGL